jgi:hypothetical protein
MRNLGLAACAVLLGPALLLNACHTPQSPGRPARAPDPSSALFESGIQYVAAKTAGWTLHVDPRFMGEVTTTFDAERDAEDAPVPSILPVDPLLSERVSALERASIPPGDIEQYAACTRYLGGIPYTGPEPRAEESATERERRRTCVPRAATAAAIFSRPRRLAPEDSVAESWTMRVYILTPVSREVSDLILVPVSPGKWAVARSVEQFRITS